MVQYRVHTKQIIVENRGQHREWFRQKERTRNRSKQRTEQRMVQNRGQNREWFKTEDITRNGS